jgi:hypothetical protein
MSLQDRTGACYVCGSRPCVCGSKAPRFNILTQKECVIDLSRPAMLYVIEALDGVRNIALWEPLTDDVICEIYNFRNLLHNLLERSEPEPQNLDLIGE